MSAGLGREFHGYPSLPFFIYGHGLPDGDRHLRNPYPGKTPFGGAESVLHEPGSPPGATAPASPSSCSFAQKPVNIAAPNSFVR